MVPGNARARIEPPVIQSVRSLRRLSPDQDLGFHVVAEVSQRRRTKAGHWFHGGSTVIIDEEGVPRYVIGKGVTSKGREAEMGKFLQTARAEYRRAARGDRGARRELIRHLHADR